MTEATPSAVPAPCSDPDCPDHPLADLRRLTKWHKDQHPELGFMRGLERDLDTLRMQVKAREGALDDRDAALAQVETLERRAAQDIPLMEALERLLFFQNTHGMDGFRTGQAVTAFSNAQAVLDDAREATR